MPPTPVDEHTEEFEQLAGLAALDVLEGDELVRFEAHLAGCERCRLMVRLDREALARAAPEMDPSPDFKARLMRRAAEEIAPRTAVVPAEPIPPRSSADKPVLATSRSRPNFFQQTLPRAHVARSVFGRGPRPVPNVIPLWRRSPWVAALAAVFVIGLVTVGAFSYENQVVASYALTGSLRGNAVVNVRRSGAAELDLRGLEAPPPGRLYEAWIIPPDGKPIPAGVTQTGDATLPLNSIASGEVIAITQEATRVEAPTSPPVMATLIQL
jgi:anti-sigma-K factor RskA